jgi:hypothetical protein
MPQLSKGGKYVFGWSKIQKDARIRLPDQAIQEYGLIPGDPIILMSGSKTSGALCVSKTISYGTVSF